MAGLLDIDYQRQIAPGAYSEAQKSHGDNPLAQGLLNAWMGMNNLQRASFLPVVGDAAGLLGDIQSMVENPEERTLLNGLLAGAGALPLIPAGMAKMYRGATDLPNESGITWVSPDKQFASGYAELQNMRGGDSPRVEIYDANPKSPVEFYHAEQRKTPDEFLGEIMEQSEGFADDELADKLYSKIVRRLGDDPVEINKMWQEPQVAEFMRQGGFDSIKVPEGGASGVETYGLLGDVKPYYGGQVDATVTASKPDYAALRAEANANRGLLDVDLGYRGLHTAPVREGRNSLDDLSDIYPDDIYNSSVAGQYYGHGDKALDDKSARIVAGFKGKPDAEIEIYRAVPKGVEDINAGDWITINPDYAEYHGSSWIDSGDYEIISRKVKARDLVTTGDSIHEWGYSPN